MGEDIHGAPAQGNEKYSEKQRNDKSRAINTVGRCAILLAETCLRYSITLRNKSTAFFTTCDICLRKDTVTFRRDV